MTDAEAIEYFRVEHNQEWRLAAESWVGIDAQAIRDRLGVAKPASWIKRLFA